MTHRIAFTFVLIFLFAVSGFSQVKPTLITALEKTISQKETAWKIERKIERELGGGSYEYTFTLKSGTNRSSIQISRLANVPNAAETFGGLVTAFDNTMGKNKTKTKLGNFGNEGFIWIGNSRNPSTTIKFRKDDIFVNVFAPSEKEARRFAEYVLEQIPKD